jgi:hypothetical protein
MNEAGNASALEMSIHTDLLHIETIKKRYHHGMTPEIVLVSIDQASIL